MLYSQFAKLSSLATLIAIVLGSTPVRAEIPLTRADIESVLNRVELLRSGQMPQQARSSDFLSTGDRLRTASSSRAELRFNDGSLARIGERATFHFVPNTRNFRLTNGTVLLLIPPQQGRTTIQTPNAVTGIQGSALIVRYLRDRNMTLVMALTDSPAGPMTVATANGSQEKPLKSGQIAMVSAQDIQIVEFDLRSFYNTSDLVRGLHLDDLSYWHNVNDPLYQVGMETTSALGRQTPFTGENVVLGPELLRPAPEAVVPSSFPSNQMLEPVPASLPSTAAETVNAVSPAETLVTPLGGIAEGTSSVSGNSEVSRGVVGPEGLIDPISGTPANSGTAATVTPGNVDGSATVDPNTGQPAASASDNAVGAGGNNGNAQGGSPGNSANAPGQVP